MRYFKADMLWFAVDWNQICTTPDCDLWSLTCNISNTFLSCDWCSHFKGWGSNFCLFHRLSLFIYIAFFYFLMSGSRRRPADEDGAEWDASGLQWHPFGSAWICYVVQGIRHTSLHSWPSYWSFLHRKELYFSSSLWDVTFSWHILTASPKSLSQCFMEICLTTSEFTI